MSTLAQLNARTLEMRKARHPLAALALFGRGLAQRAELGSQVVRFQEEPAQARRAQLRTIAQFATAAAIDTGRVPVTPR